MQKVYKYKFRLGFALSTYELKNQNMGVETVELQLKKIADLWHIKRKITTAELSYTFKEVCL